MRLWRHLLWVDCIGAAAAGVGMLLLSGPLTDLYAFPPGLLILNGCANLLYGGYSFSLAVRRRRPMPLLVALAVANMAWAVVCWVLAGMLAGSASAIGLGTLIGEGVYVGGLGAVEWRLRERLRTAG